MHLHGQVISAGELSSHLPSRDRFVASLFPEDYQEVSDTLRNHDPILFMPTTAGDQSFGPYNVMMMGVLPDGRKATVLIDRIIPQFYVFAAHEEEGAPAHKLESAARKVAKEIDQVLAQLTAQKYRELVNKHYKNEELDLTPLSVDIELNFKPLIGFSPNRAAFVRVRYTQLYKRVMAIKCLQAMRKYETYDDDITNYFRVVARDNCLSLSSWCSLRTYRVVPRHDKIVGLVLVVKLENIKPYEGDVLGTPKLFDDRSLSISWDIETYSPRGALPLPENEDDVMFMIGCTVHWYWANTPLLQVCIIDKPCSPHSDFLAVITKDETETIRAFAMLIAKLQPEFMYGFNIFRYDFDWLFLRSCQFQVFDELVSKMSMETPGSAKKGRATYRDGDWHSMEYRNLSIKYEGGTHEGFYITSRALVNVDVLSVMMQKYPKALSKKLDSFLKQHNLPTKKDMPIARLFQIYKDAVSVAETESFSGQMLLWIASRHTS
jgi:DNA polymerase elongation subunit (family B)